MELSLLSTYSDAAKGKPLALIGSSGFLEVAVNQGSAAEMFSAGAGEPVVVQNKYGVSR